MEIGIGKRLYMEIKQEIKVGITGQSGFIGNHLYNYLKLKDDIQIVPFKKKYYDDVLLLKKFVKKCDVIVHLAGISRHENDEFLYQTNIELTAKLIGACDSVAVSPKILFASSIQQNNKTSYGESKKRSVELLNDWANKNKTSVLSMVIPNVFGPFGKPFHNSVVSTFCHQLVNGETPTIIKNKNLSLIYINQLTQDIYELILSERTGNFSIEPRYKVSVKKILSILTKLKCTYIENSEFPELKPFTLALFNTLRSHIKNDMYPIQFKKHTDERGAFVEIVRTNTSGQFSYSSTKPGITRGQHFHTRKIERFTIIQGKARVSLRRVGADDTINFFLDGDSPAYIDIPVWHTHNVTNIGNSELLMLYWTNEIYNPEDPDTYYEKV